MPRFDGTGPRGLGPLTGLRNGPCAPQRKGRRRGWLGNGRLGFRRGRMGGVSGLGLADSSSLEEVEQALEAELETVRKARESQKEG